MSDSHWMTLVAERSQSLSDFDRLQIRQAASGCMDATISDWGYLEHALAKAGIELHPHTPARVVTAICQFIEASGYGEPIVSPQDGS